MSVLRPGDQAILRLRLALNQRRELKLDPLPRAAVLVPLIEEPAGFSLLFTRRSGSVKTHQGQVAFPGGHVEPGDADVVATALREAHEEIGLSPEQVDVLGLGNDVVSITQVHVTPVIGCVRAPFVPVLDPREIDLCFMVPLQHLADPAARISSYRRQTPLGELEFPVYSGGPDPIWGLTAWIVTELLPLLQLE
jgi:8-oxo-dGTP pyrophosphatase MutT (NUDIX family)